MSKYIDLYLLPLPEDNVPAYKKLAITAGKVFIKHGALKYREYVGADLAIQGMVPFSKPLKLNPGETVIACVVEFRSEKHRNAVMKKAMKDPELTLPDIQPPVFNVKRLVYGGFKILVDL